MPALLVVAGGVGLAVGSRFSGGGQGDAALGADGGSEVDPVDLVVEGLDAGPVREPTARAATEERDPLDDPVEEEPPPEIEPGLDAGAARADVTVHVGRVGEGNTVHKRLTEHGLSAREAHAVVTALAGHYDFRKSRPTHTYRLELSRDDRSVVRFRYQPGLTEIYEVRPGSEGYVGRRVRVPTKLIRVSKGFRVRGTLSESIVRAGLKRRILSVFLRTFDSDINFQNDQREGDTFRVILDEEQLRGRYIGYKTVWAIEYAGERVGKRAAFFFRPPSGRGRFYDDRGRSTERSVLRTPVSYSRITSPFDPRRMHPILRRRVPHNGVDFAAPRGTAVWATADGVVRFAGRKGAAGNLVVLRHEGGLESIYAHLQRIGRGIKRGTEVRQRQVIGFVGSTGRSTGPHLHFGLRKGGRYMDPLKVKSRPGPPIDRRYRHEFRAHAKKLARELESIPVR